MNAIVDDVADDTSDASPKIDLDKDDSGCSSDTTADEVEEIEEISLRSADFPFQNLPPAAVGGKNRQITHGLCDNIII